MKRFLVIALTALLVVGLTSSAFAVHFFNGAHQGNGRLIAMGLQNYQTTDLGNIWINPAYANSYKNKVWGFISGYQTLNTQGTNVIGQNRTTEWGGAHFDTPIGVLGIWLDRPDTSTVSVMDDLVGGTGYDALPAAYTTGSTNGFTGMATLGGVGATAPSNNLDLFWGMDMGVALIGARLNININNSDVKEEFPATAQALATAGVRLTQTEDSIVTKARDLGVHLGVAMKELPIAASVLIGLPNLESTATVSDKAETDLNANGVVDTTDTTDISDKLESDGAMNIGVYVNGMLKMSDKNTLVPTVYFETSKNDSKREMSYTNTATTADSLAAGTTTTTSTRSGKREDKGTLFGIDAALNMKANENTLVVTAIGLTYDKEEQTMKNEIATDQTVAGAVTTFNNESHGVQDDIKVEESTISIPFVVGVESKASSRVTARLGVKGNLYSYNKETVEEKVFYNDTAVNPDVTKETTTFKDESILSGTGAATVSMGLSIKFSDSIGMTALLNQDILFSGTYLISGVPETLFTSLSVAYSF